MDINDLKRKSFEVKEEEERLESTRVTTLERFEVFVKTCSKLNKPITEKVATKKLELAGEFRAFFESNGFVVEHEKKGKYKAVFEETVVILEDETPDEYESGSVFDLRIPIQKKLDGVVIKPEQKNDSKLYWKNNLKYDGRSIGFDNARELILSIKDMRKLEVLLSKINDNIDWYEGTIESFDKIKFVYSIYKTDQEFDTFQELFEAL